MPLEPTDFMRNALLCCVLAVCSVSCVNEDYDLTKEIDTKMNISGDISAPLGNSELILVGEFLNLDNDDENVLKTDSDGNYYVSVTGSGSAADVYVPSFSIDGALVSDGGFRASIRRDEVIGRLFPGTSLSPGDIPIPAGASFSQEFAASDTPLEVSQSVPSEIVDIRELSASAYARVTLGTNAGKAVVSGLTLTFPEYIGIESASGEGCAFDKTSNSLSFSPVEINTTTRTVMLAISGIDFRKIPAGQGFIRSEHRIVLNDAVKLSAFTADLKLGDFGTRMSDLPASLEVNIGVDVPAMSVKDVTVKVSPQINLPDQVVEVGTMPDFLNGAGVILDLYDPMLSVNVDNRSPLALILDADVQSFKGSQTRSVHIGSAGSAPTSEIRVAADARTEVFISRTGLNAPARAVNVEVPGLSDIMKTVPEKIGISGIGVKASDDYVTVISGNTYSLSYDYAMKAPLAFGNDLNIEYHTDFDGWNETFNPKDGKDSFDMEVKNADVSFDFVNTIPLNLILSAQAIDVAGNVIPGITVSLDGTVPAGSLEKPATKALTLNMKAPAEAMRRLDGIRLNMRAASGSGEYQGVCLNKNQGVRLTDMKLKLQGSVDVEL